MGLSGDGDICVSTPNTHVLRVCWCFISMTVKVVKISHSCQVAAQYDCDSLNAHIFLRSKSATCLSDRPVRLWLTCDKSNYGVACRFIFDKDRCRETWDLSVIAPPGWGTMSVSITGASGLICLLRRDFLELGSTDTWTSRPSRALLGRLILTRRNTYSAPQSRHLVVQHCFVISTR
jgi:hypothetical protein